MPKVAGQRPAGDSRPHEVILNRVIAEVEVWNIPAIRIYDKLHMEMESIINRFYDKI